MHKNTECFNSPTVACVIKPTSQMTKSRRMRWAKRVVCMGWERSTYGRIYIYIYIYIRITTLYRVGYLVLYKAMFIVYNIF
jgi:hypothetical protein